MIWIKAYANAGTLVWDAADYAIRTARITQCGVNLTVSGVTILVKPDTKPDDAVDAHRAAMQSREITRIGNAVAFPERTDELRRPPGPPSPPRPEKPNEWA